MIISHFFLFHLHVLSHVRPHFMLIAYTLFLENIFYANHPMVVEHYVNQYKVQQILLCILREF